MPQPAALDGKHLDVAMQLLQQQIVQLLREKADWLLAAVVAEWIGSKYAKQRY